MPERTTLMELSPGYEEIVNACREDGHSTYTCLYDERIVVWEYDGAEPIRVWWTLMHSARFSWKPVDYIHGRYCARINNIRYLAPEES